MALSDREKIISLIANGITVFSLLRERQELPQHATMHGFVLNLIPNDLRAELSADLIDEVFQYVTSAHSS